MLLKDYKLEIFKSKCQPAAMGVHCHAHFGQDVSCVLPYLNAVLGGFEYVNDPPALTLRSQGKLITVHGDKAAVNALKDELEAHKIVEWLKNEINATWERKDEITPSSSGQERPKLFEILKLLPKTNCKKCGLPTCTVFAAQAMEGGRGGEDCPELSPPDRERLAAYLEGFSFD